MIRAAAISIMMGLLLASPAAADETKDEALMSVAGHWVFSADTRDGCTFNGDAFLRPTEDPTVYDCELTARQDCGGFGWVVRQSCVAHQIGEQVSINSTIEEFLEGGETPSYAPDNFSLTIQDKYEMRGALISYGIHSAVFRRPTGAVS